MLLLLLRVSFQGCRLLLFLGGGGRTAFPTAASHRTCVGTKVFCGRRVVVAAALRGAAVSPVSPFRSANAVIVVVVVDVISVTVAVVLVVAIVDKGVIDLSGVGRADA